MSAVNVMKKVKTRAPRVKTTAKKRQPTAVVTFKFNSKNPYSAFHDIPIQDVDDAIEAYIATLKPTNILEISTMRRIRTSLPWFLLNEFLNSLRQNQSATAAFEQFRRRRNVQEAIAKMRLVLESRRVDNIPPPERAPPHRLRMEQPPHRQTRNVKYASQILQAMTKEQLAAIARRERVIGFATLTKKQLVAHLVHIENPTSARRPERSFGTEFTSACESRYRRAPWMAAFTSEPIATIAVRSDSDFATQFVVRDDWVRSTSRFYSNACNFGRKFVPDAVAYVTVSGEVIVETKEMYNASLRNNEIRTTKRTMLGLLEPGSRRENIPPMPTIIESQRESPIIESRRESPIIEAAPEIELAPGLFSYVRTIIGGQTVYCDACNIMVAEPMFKSVHDNQLVMFCGKECFEAYQFRKS